MRLKGKLYEDITLEKAVKLGYVIGRSAGPRNLVVSGRDAFRVSRMLKRAITAGVMSAGADVMDFHESLNGEIAFAIKRFGAKMGFMVSIDPSTGGVLLKIFSSPGYELAGESLKRIIREAEEEKREARSEIGWVYYAEYVHRLYTSAISSFVKGDIITSRKISSVVAPDYEPLESILTELARGLGVSQIIIGDINPPTHPFSTLMKKIWSVRRALQSDIGVLFSHDGSALTLCLEGLGFLLPEELLLYVIQKYGPGSRVLVLNPVFKKTIEYLEKEGYKITIVDDEEKFHFVNRRERPVISMTWRGEYITPLFSLGFDAIILYAQVLEALSDIGLKPLDTVKSIREELHRETLSLNNGLEICREADETTLWGCRILRDNKLITLIYNPEADGFIKLEGDKF